MAVEERRGCGYRKVGGLYLIADGSGMSCCKMPIILHVCPTCAQGIKQTRGWTWIDPRPWLKDDCTAGPAGKVCPLNNPQHLGDRVGLLWIGEKFYPSPAHFTQEADKLGICKRIKAVPRGFKLGRDWVFFAHPKAMRVHGAMRLDEEGNVHYDTEVAANNGWMAGVIRIARPRAIEKIVTETEFKDSDAMMALRDKGITPIPVPDNDRDHQGSVYDKDEEGLL